VSTQGVASRSSGRIIGVAVLVIIGVLAIIAGVIYLAEPAKSLPSILGPITHPVSRADAHRSLRGAGAVVVGVICLVAASIVGMRGRSPQR
jgi:drug/metabolite transporter (DMT)-like permease